MPHKNASQLFNQPEFPGLDQIASDEIMGVPILIQDYHIKTMQFGDVAIIKWTHVDKSGESTGNPMSTLIGGKVLLSKLAEARKKNYFPFVATIVADNRYYDFI